MKKLLYFFSCSAFLICCKKNNSSDSGTHNIITLRVLESVTQKPVPGAIVSLLKCTQPNLDFSCSHYEAIKTLTTNSNGEFEFDESLVDRIAVSASNYWSNETIHWTDIYLAPFAWINVHAVKVNSYPTKSRLNLLVQNNAGNFYDTQLLLNDVPDDTTTTITCVGNANSYLIWSVVDSLSNIITGSMRQTQPQFINAFDTLHLNIQY
ncbi:MAG: hypothetical protein ACRDE5_17990 [Ginsengibacter sp.]